MKPPPRPVIRWPGRKPRSAPIPPARDPFVNTPLLRLTPDAKGVERFWISSFNGAFGSLGVCVTERGEARLYPFGSFRHPGFYSAAQTGPDELWLCGNLADMVRLDLKTGKFETFETGAPSALVFAGMAHDAPSGKVCAIAFPPPRTVAMVFDTRARKTVKTEELQTLDHYQRSHVANPDGTYSIQLQCPGLTYATWNPKDDSIALRSILKELETHGAGNLVYRTIQDDGGRAYLPGVGRLDPVTGAGGAGPRPADDTVTWFARDGEWAVGQKAGAAELRRWNLKTGEEKALPAFAGMNHMNTALTAAGKLVSVTKDGTFVRLDARTGELELCRELPTDAVQPADCAIRIDRDRVLGTPFITQRFWETNLRTKKGIDCGAAAPGGGEILQVWNLGGLVYMAAYTGGELMAYDPARPARFPENPRVVAKPPTGMRPVAAADDGRRLYYACSHHYGHLGSVAVRYDTKTGEALYRDNPLPGQQICSLCVDRAANALLCGTTYEADCASAPPATDRTRMAILDADTLAVRQACDGPAGAVETRVIGPLGRGRWLGVCRGAFENGRGARWFVCEPAAWATPEPAALRELSGWGGTIQYAGRAGLFVLRMGDRIELWDMRKPARLKVLGDSPHLCHFFVQGRDLLVWSAWDVFVLEDALA